MSACEMFHDSKTDLAKVALGETVGRRLQLFPREGKAIRP